MEREHHFGTINELQRRLERVEQRAEDAHRTSEAKWRNILVNVPLIGIALDCEARIVFCNNHFLDLTGWELDELLGRDWFYLCIPADVGDTVRAVFEQVMQAGDTHGFSAYENEILTKSGERLSIGWSNVLTRDVNGAIVDVTCLGVDLTERKRAEERDRYQLGLITALLNSIPEIVFYKDLDGVYLGCNEEFARHVGRSREDVVGATDHDLYDADVADEFRRKDLRVLEHRAPESSEEWVTYPDGRRVPVDTLKTELRDADGKLIGTLGVARDITERKRIEEALREAEGRVRRKLRAIIDPEEDIKDLTLKDLVDTETVQVLMDDLYRLTGYPAGVLDHEGNIIVATGWQDICTRFHRAHPETLRACVVSDTQLTRDVAQGTFRAYKCQNNLWDISTPIMLGDKAVGNLFLGQFFFEDEEVDEELFRQQARRYGFDEHEYIEALRRVPRWDRETVERIIGFYSRFAEFVSSQSYGTLKLARSLEERQRVEAERERLREQLVRAQKLEVVGRLAGGVAHDFNNMLNVIIGHADILLDEMHETAPERAGLEEIRKAAERSANVTRQLLAFARRQNVEPKVLDLNQTVESMLKMLRRLIGEDVDLLWRPGRRLYSIRIDPTQVDQILANLCVNARDAIGRDGGTVTIETANVELDAAYCESQVSAVPGKYVLLAVSDNGCGMDPETQANIFEPFFTTKDVGKGTGLGLATIFGIVRQNGGFINVYSEVGLGSSFKVYVPIDEAAGRTEPKRTIEVDHTGAETVLLVEDELPILRVAETMLQRLGYTVISAQRPTDAIRRAEAHNGTIELLVSDVIMPEMKGPELARELRGRFPQLRILYMSGYTDTVIGRQGVLESGVGFISKPFSKRELGAKVRDVLDHGPPDDGAAS